MRRKLKFSQFNGPPATVTVRMPRSLARRIAERADDERLSINEWALIEIKRALGLDYA